MRPYAPRHVVAALLFLAAAVPHGASRAQSARSLPAEFGLGVHAHREIDAVVKWMPDTGVPWTYAYHYLSGGLNTGNSWPTWDAKRNFALDFAQEAKTNRYVPVFVMDQLLSSKSTCPEECGEDRYSLTNLNDPAITKLWFEETTLFLKLMSQQGMSGQWGFGGRVILVVEPHVAGYAQTGANVPDKCYGFCTGTGDDPALVKAAVKSSGVTDVQDFEDTLAGFMLAVLHLRDEYAPNVLLALHASAHAVVEDLRLSLDPDLNPAELGRRTGEFLSRAGARTDGFDLLAADVDWADAALARSVYDVKNAYWDRSNVQFPNFVRYQRWARGVTVRTGLKMLLFNVPIGNQRYRTMNNKEGHYQDNRAEYFLTHTEDLQAHGIAGLLFGSTTGGATFYWDSQGDKVTNPEPVCTTDGDSQATEPICPNRRSTVADDDGGFLREAAAAFYAGDPSPVPFRVATGAGVLVAVGAGAAVAMRRRRRPRPGPPGPESSFASGRFDVVRPLGEGAMKRVYLARDNVLRRDVAVAVLRADELDEASLERARREAQALARLGDHPNVVSVYDTGEEGGRPYIVCQYLPGGSLRDVLRTRGRLEVGEAATLALELCEALRHAHAAGILHRDVKPANVWLDSSGHALLGDFGLASSVDLTRMTATGVVLGTVAYMAPEQASGEPQAASDVYALGVLVHEMLTGAPPFTGGTMAVLHQQLHATPDPPSARARGVPPVLDRLVGDLLAKDPAARPDAGEAAARLRAILQAIPDAAAPDVYVERSVESTVVDEGEPPPP